MNEPQPPGFNLHELMKENVRIARDNNRMLRAMRRDAWFGFFGKLILWALVLGAPLYLYYAYLAPLIGTYTPTEGQGQAPSPLSLDQLSELLKTYGGGQ